MLHAHTNTKMKKDSGSHEGDHPEEGVTTYHYTYTKFDKHKNWIERKISYSTEYDKYDENGDYIGDEYTSPKRIHREKRH